MFTVSFQTTLVAFRCLRLLEVCIITGNVIFSAVLPGKPGLPTVIAEYEIVVPPIYLNVHYGKIPTEQCLQSLRTSGRTLYCKVGHRHNNILVIPITRLCCLQWWNVCVYGILHNTGGSGAVR